jgi:hypothetical protein
MSHPRRIMHPSAVSSFTRGEFAKHPNMNLPHEIVHMDEKYHKDTRKYNAYKRSMKKAAKKTAGRRPRKTRRHTRRH